MDEINEMILRKINDSKEDEWIKDFVKQILSFENTQYTGAGGEYKQFYKDTALKSYED